MNMAHPPTPAVLHQLIKNQPAMPDFSECKMPQWCQMAFFNAKFDKCEKTRC